MCQAGEQIAQNHILQPFEAFAYYRPWSLR